MEIIKDIRNDLLKRQWVNLSLEAEKNPNFDEIKKQVAEKFKKPEENIDVYNIKGSFGSNKFKIDAYIYDSKEDLEKATPKVKKKKTEKEKPEKEEEKEEAEGEEKIEETKKEKEVKEEKIEEKPATDKESSEQEKSLSEKEQEISDKKDL